MIRLLEREVAVRCRKEDVGLVESVLADAEREFATLCAEKTRFKIQTKLTVDKHDHLNPTMCQ
jgi:hypothetical protein